MKKKINEGIEKSKKEFTEESSKEGELKEGEETEL